MWGRGRERERGGMGVKAGQKACYWDPQMLWQYILLSTDVTSSSYVIFTCMQAIKIIVNIATLSLSHYLVSPVPAHFLGSDRRDLRPNRSSFLPAGHTAACGATSRPSFLAPPSSPPPGLRPLRRTFRFRETLAVAGNSKPRVHHRRPGRVPKASQAPHFGCKGQRSAGE